MEVPNLSQALVQHNRLPCETFKSEDLAGGTLRQDDPQPLLSDGLDSTKPPAVVLTPEQLLETELEELRQMILSLDSTQTRLREIESLLTRLR